MRETRFARLFLFVITVIVAICVGVAAVFGIVYAYKAYKRSIEERELLDQQKNSEIFALENEKNELEQQVEALKNTALGGDVRYGSIIILFATPMRMIEPELVPRMDVYSMAGTVACREDALPGTENCMTVNAALELQQKGWDFCLNVTSQTRIDELYNELLKIGIKPVSAYFPNNDMTPEQQAQLSKLGITTIMLLNESQPVSDDTVTCITAYGNNVEDYRGVIHSYVNDNKPIAMVIGRENSYEKSTIGQFSLMISQYQEYVVSNIAAVVPSSHAKERLEQAASIANKAISDGINDEIQSINDKIKIIDDKIRDLYN